MGRRMHPSSLTLSGGNPEGDLCVLDIVLHKGHS
jgi:hypothetical protein